MDMPGLDTGVGTIGAPGAGAPVKFLSILYTFQVFLFDLSLMVKVDTRASRLSNHLPTPLLEAYDKYFIKSPKPGYHLLSRQRITLVPVVLVQYLALITLPYHAPPFLQHCY